MIARTLVSRPLLLVAANIAALIGLTVLRFEVEAQGVMLLAIVPIVALATMYGVWGGVLSALYASAISLTWGLTSGDSDLADHVGQPLTFFVLGVITGIYAGGTLGDFDPRHVARRAELRAALRSHEVKFHYQPLAEARTGRVIGVEALARWEHPGRGLLPPAEFISLAEGDEQTIWELTMHAVESALTDLASWGEGGRELSVSVNLSPVNLERRDLSAAFAQVIAAHPAGRLALEITESALVQDPEGAGAALEKLKGLGVSIGLDDFGTGYSSLSHLRQFPLDTVKLDIDAIRRRVLHESEAGLRSLIEFIHALGLQVVAERVEDRRTWDTVAEMGCDVIQGYQLGRPMPSSEVPGWLERSAPLAAASDNPPGA